MTGEHGRPQSLGLQRAGDELATEQQPSVITGVLKIGRR